MMNRILLALLLLIHTRNIVTLPETIQIGKRIQTISNDHFISAFIPLGGLFTPEQREEEFMFRLAVNNINEDATILSRTKLVAQVNTIDYFDSFHANKRGSNFSIELIN